MRYFKREEARRCESVGSFCGEGYDEAFQRRFARGTKLIQSGGYNGMIDTPLDHVVTMPENQADSPRQSIAAQISDAIHHNL